MRNAILTATLGILFTGLANKLSAQTITGTSDVLEGSTHTYSYSGSSASNWYWRFSNPDGVGTKISESSSTVTITWNGDEMEDSSSDILMYTDGNTVLAQLSIRILAPTQALAATNVSTTSFTARWSSRQFATEYRLDVSTDNNFSTLIYGYSDLPVTGTSKSITGLLTGTQYYYRLRAVGAAGTTVNSNTQEVLTSGPPQPPLLNEETITATSFTASWSSPSATSYLLDVSDNSGAFVSSYHDFSLSTTSQTVNGLSSGTVYHYSVRAVNSSGTSGSSSSSVLTLPAAPEATAATNLMSTSFRANWNGVTGADSYELDVSVKSDFSSFVTRLTNLTGTYADISDLTGKTKYYYRMRAVNASGNSAYSNTILAMDLDHNYIRTTNVTVAGKMDVAAAEGGTVNERIIKYDFFDGLGRPSQSVSMQASPLQYDIVQPVVYDAYGREAVKYLPYIASEDNGWYKPNPISTGNYSASPQAVFYNSGSTTIAQDAAPYAQTEFEASPLNRVLKQGAPGAAWQPDEVPGSDHSMKKAYGFNGENEVIRFTYDETTEGISTSEYYAPNQLYANKTTDEHNHEVIEYVDKEGRTVLKKVQYEEVNGEKHYAQTYYIYDDFGNLVVVLPPEASAAIEGSMDE